jgi:hypothetical protein
LPRGAEIDGLALEQLRLDERAVERGVGMPGLDPQERRVRRDDDGETEDQSIRAGHEDDAGHQRRDQEDRDVETQKREVRRHRCDGARADAGDGKQHEPRLVVEAARGEERRSAEPPRRRRDEQAGAKEVRPAGRIRIPYASERARDGQATTSHEADPDGSEAGGQGMGARHARGREHDRSEHPVTVDAGRRLARERLARAPFHPGALGESEFAPRVIERTPLHTS